MHKIVLFMIVFAVLVSCDQKKKSAKVDVTAYEIATENWPKKSILNLNAMAVLKEWPEYMELDQIFDGLYTVENTEDLSLIIEDLIAKQQLLTVSEYPEVFNQPQIKSRQKVFQTFVLKTKGDLEYRLDPQESTIEMIDSYNAMRNQFKIITSNTLDIKKLLEEF